MNRFRMWVVAAVFAASALAPTAASAHTQIVYPRGQDSPTVEGPISNPWAQAHCNANSPSVVADASGGVVAFLPAGALPCPPTPNPGGQIHP